MKSFNTVYRNSRSQILAERKRAIDDQKNKVVKQLKEDMLITKPLLELSEQKQNEVMNKLLMYWQPNTGLTPAGEAYLDRREITVNENSTRIDLKQYIEDVTRKNLAAITEAYRSNNVQSIISFFKRDLNEKTGRMINDTFINDVVWNMVSERIKTGGF